jgi:hypothetical protein
LAKENKVRKTNFNYINFFFILLSLLFPYDGYLGMTVDYCTFWWRGREADCNACWLCAFVSSSYAAISSEDKDNNVLDDACGSF